MSDERRGGGQTPQANQVKVVDRRRFRPDGGPMEEEAGGPPGPTEGEAGAGRAAGEERAVGADPRDAVLAAQAARLDELSRAYAALVEDNKAFRARQERERTRLVEAERASVAQGLLEAADDLERALAAVSGVGGSQGEALRTLVDGVRLSLGGLRKRIGELGAQRLTVVGEPFDPRFAEAVDTIAVADQEQDGVVLQEVRSGYRIGDRVLRPARVRVGRLARA
ncbi:MAG TPA: nucleotide exchange factor GrpE [Anaeromyxobacteraceae bacterium]|nr:nucleotide exchange factor GrpE [Anaeromyxobacteraceae bacterium]